MFNSSSEGGPRLIRGNSQCSSSEPCFAPSTSLRATQGKHRAPRLLGVFNTEIPMFLLTVPRVNEYAVYK
jgi:hypothetical protein